MKQIPINSPGGGAFTFRQNFKVGDVGTMTYIDHDMDNPYDAGDNSDPSTRRTHQGGDAVFMGKIPAGTKKQSTLPPGTFGFGTASGKDYLVIWPDGHIDIISTQPINAKSDLEVNVEAGTTASVKAGVSATVDAPVIDLTGNVTINGNLHVTGSITPWPS
ncbi:hypothetical protein FACS1894184_13990 [Clostridia bacterium]|nr:hypothetical protein FACS1894184_13990 [Clostridia bacterium]